MLFSNSNVYSLLIKMLTRNLVVILLLVVHNNFQKYVIIVNGFSPITRIEDLSETTIPATIPTDRKIRHKFPIRELFDIPSDFEFPPRVGLEQYLCNTQNSQAVKCCKCDSGCLRRRDCCIDVFWNELEPPSYNDYINSFLSRIRNTPPYTCEYVYPRFDPSRQSSETRLMIKNCPKNTEYENLCLNSIISPNIRASIPVISEDKVLYANVFCALCNGIRNYRFAILKLECSSFVDLEEDHINTTEFTKRITTEESGCLYTIPEKENNLYSSELCRRGTEKPKRQCKDNLRDINSSNQLCSSYSAGINNYANYHCLKCNNESTPWNFHISYCKYATCSQLCTRKTTTPIPTTTSVSQTFVPTTSPPQTSPPPTFVTIPPQTTVPTTFPPSSLAPTTVIPEKTLTTTFAPETILTTTFVPEPILTTTFVPTTMTIFTTPFPTVLPSPTKRKRSLSLLLNFSPDITYQIIVINGRQSRDNVCPQENSFDPSLGICVKYSCGSAFSIVSGICVDHNNNNEQEFAVNIENATFEKCLIARGSRLVVILQTNATNVKHYQDKFIKSFKEKFSSINGTFRRVIVNSSFYESQYNVSNTGNSTPKDIILELSEPISLDLLRNFSQNLHTVEASSIYDYYVTSPLSKSLMLTASFDPTNTFPNKSCFIYEEINRTKLTFDKHCSVNFENETFPTENISMWIDFKLKKKGITICKRFYLSKPCLRKTFHENVTLDTISHNITAHLPNNSTVIYSPEEYQPINGGYSVCITTSDVSFRIVPRNPDLVKLSNIEDKITLVGSCISIICYVWIITTYLMFRDLRNLPGYSYVFMCGCLLLSDCMFITSVQVDVNTVPCATMAILMHWSLMCSFMWTIVIAFDLVSKFSSYSTRKSHSDCLKQIKRRCLLSFSVPTVYIATLVTLDKTLTVSIHYGKYSCWISNFYARLAFYVIPVALITILTFLALIYTIIKIKMEQKRNESVLQTKRTSNLLRIALKLTIILGVTELIGYIQIGVSNPNKYEEIFNAVFQFIYSVTRSLRGVMLWIVLIIGAGMMKKYRKHFVKTRRYASVKGKLPRLNKNTEISNIVLSQVTSEL